MIEAGWTKENRTLRSVHFAKEEKKLRYEYLKAEIKKKLENMK